MNDVHSRYASRSPAARTGRYAVLVVLAIVLVFPVYTAVIASTHTQTAVSAGVLPIFPGTQGPENYRAVLSEGSKSLGVNAGRLLFNSFACALGISVGKIALSLMTAYALVFFRFPGRGLMFGLMLLTLMLPVEVRIIPTFEVVTKLGMGNTYAGLILPLTVSATAVFLLRQTFMAFPRSLAEAAEMDGIGPIGFFVFLLIPMIRNEIGALFVIMFVYGWNQYLWPLVISSRDSLYTLPIGINRMLASGDLQAEWQLVMAVAVLAMIPPLALMSIFQKNIVDQSQNNDK